MITGKIKQETLLKLQHHQHDIPHWWHPMSRVRDIMKEYNRNPNIKPVVKEVTFWQRIFGADNNLEYEPILFENEKDFIYSIRNGEITVYTEVDIVSLYYKALDIRKVSDVVTTSLIGDGQVFCDTNTLKSVTRVANNIEDYMKL